MSYFGIIHKKHDLTLESFVLWNTSYDEVSKFLVEKESISLDDVLVIEEIPSIEFHGYEPLLVKSNENGLVNLKSHFFEGGNIGCDLFDETYVFSYVKNKKPTSSNIGKTTVSVIKDSELVTIKQITLEELDEGHLTDRLSAELVRIYLAEKTLQFVSI